MQIVLLTILCLIDSIGDESMKLEDGMRDVERCEGARGSFR